MTNGISHFMPGKTQISGYCHDFNQGYIFEKMRYGFDSKCVGKLTLWAIQRTPNGDRIYLARLCGERLIVYKPVYRASSPRA